MSADALITLLVAMGEKAGGYPVTLAVPGATITGTVIGGREWYRRLREVARLPDEVGMRLPRIADFEQHTDDDSSHNFLYLADVGVLSGGASLQTDPPSLWRVRVSEVSGISLGRMVFRS